MARAKDLLIGGLLIGTVAGCAAGGSVASPSGSAFYVAPDGNDSWEGDMAAPNAVKTNGPFASLARAQRAMEDSAVKVTYVERGTYHLTRRLRLTAADDGETWRYYPPNGVNTAVLDGGGTLAPIIDIGGGASRITIDGLKLENFGIVGIHVGAGKDALSSKIAVKNCDIGFGHNTSNATSGGIVFDNTVDIEVANNYIHAVPAAGIAVYAYNPGDRTGGVIANNVVWDAVQARSDSGAIYTEMLSTAASSLTIKNNFVANYGSAGHFGQVGIYLDEGANHVTVAGNVVGPPLRGSVADAGTNNTGAAFTDAGFDNTFFGNIVDLGDSGRVFAVEFYGYPAYGESGNVFEGNIILSNFTGAQATNMSGKTGFAYFQNIGSGSNYTIRHNVYWNYASGGSVFTNGVLAGDSEPIFKNPQVSGPTYTVDRRSSVYSPPVNFAPIVGGWGPPGFVIPQIDTPSHRGQH